MVCCAGTCPRGCELRVSPLSDLVSFPSRDDQVQEFLNVGISKSKLPGGQSESVATALAGCAQKALSHLRFAGYIGLLGVVCPVLFFACLLPLEIDDLPFELWSTFYSMIMRLAFLVQGSCLVWISLRQVPSTLTLAAFYVCAVVFDAIRTFYKGCSGLTASPSVGMAGLFACLLFPSVYVACSRMLQGYRVRSALMHIVGLMTGAIPPFVAATYYYLLHHRGWKDKTPLLILALFLWSLTPLLLKSLGKPIWLRGAPALPGMMPVLWIYYCEVSFSCFGFMVFMHTPASTISYALSLSPVLCIQILRGTRWAFECMPCMGTLTLHRLMLYLDSFAAVMGRIAAYTLYVCFSILRLCKPSQGLIAVRHSLITGKDMVMALSINIYRQQTVTEARLWMGVCGMVLVLCSYTVFSFVVPKVWKLTPSSRVTPVPPEVVGGPDDGDAGQVVSPTMSSKLRAWGSQRSNQSNRSGWLQGRASSTAVFVQQHELLLKFMADFMGFMIVTLIFVFGLSVLQINLVLFFLYQDKGMHCD